MKKITLGLLASMMLFPVISFAQTNPPAPAAWVAFQQQERTKISAFFQQIKADRDTFLSENPQVKAYLAQLQANAKTRMAAWKAAHQNKI